MIRAEGWRGVGEDAAQGGYPTSQPVPYRRIGRGLIAGFPPAGGLSRSQPSARASERLRQTGQPLATHPGFRVAFRGSSGPEPAPPTVVLQSRAKASSAASSAVHTLPVLNLPRKLFRATQPHVCGY
jgi:hypothetical protein